jgi:hypothetical protein
MSGFTIACILGNNLKRKISDENQDNEHQLHKRQTIEGNEIFLIIFIFFLFRFLIDHFNSFFFSFNIHSHSTHT